MGWLRIIKEKLSQNSPKLSPKRGKKGENSHPNRKLSLFSYKNSPKLPPTWEFFLCLYICSYLCIRNKGKTFRTPSVSFRDAPLHSSP